MIFDTHCHYDDEKYDNDRDELIKAVLADKSGYNKAAADRIRDKYLGSCDGKVSSRLLENVLPKA